MKRSDDDAFDAFLAAALDPGEIELGPERHAELRAAIGVRATPPEENLNAFTAFLAERLDPGEIELDDAARRRITGASEELRPGDLISWALGELSSDRRERVEEILSARPDLRDEALSVRHFCLRLRDRLPVLPRPGFFRRKELRRLYREQGGQKSRPLWQPLAGIAALVTLLLTPALLQRGQGNGGGGGSDVAAASSSRGHQGKGGAVAFSSGQAGPGTVSSHTFASGDRGPATSAPEIALVPTSSPHSSVAELALAPAPLEEKTVPVSVPAVAIAEAGPTPAPLHHLPVPSSFDRAVEILSQATNQLTGQATFDRHAGTLLASMPTPVQSLSVSPTRSSFAAVSPMAMIRSFGFDATNAAFLIDIPSGSVTAPPPDPATGGEGETGTGTGTTTGEENATARKARALVVPLENGAAVLANLQPYLLMALAGSSDTGAHSLVDPAAGFVWNVNAGYRTLDFDSFAAGAGMKLDTWTGSLSVAKGLTDTLTLGANLSSLDSRGSIDRFGKIDVTGTVAGWSLDWQRDGWELGASHSIAFFRQDLLRTSGGAGTASEDATLQQVDLHAGWKTDLGPFRQGPVANLEASWGHLDGYLEPGASGLSMASRDFHSLTLLTGWELTGAFDTAAGTWSPHVLAGWRHRFSVPDSAVHQADSGAVSVFQPDVPDRNSVLLQAGLQWTQCGNGPLYAEAAAGVESRGGNLDRSLLFRVGAKF